MGSYRFVSKKGELDLYKTRTHNGLRAPGIKVNKYNVHTESNLHQYLTMVREMALNKFFYSAAYSQSISLREDQTARDAGRKGNRKVEEHRATSIPEKSSLCISKIPCYIPPTCV